MRRFSILFIVLGLISISAASSRAQTRSFGAGSLILDDGLGHTYTVQGAGTGGTYTLPPGGGALVTSTSPGSLPLGGIIMWSGSIGLIPTGWALCDGGTHNAVLTPDLRNRFIVAAGNTYAVGATGGSTSPTYTASGSLTTNSATTGLSVNSATTGISVNSAYTGLSLGSYGPYTFDNSTSDFGGSTSNVYVNTYISSDPGHTHTINDPGHTHSINDPGHSHSITNFSGMTISTPSNLPPYYALAYIMRVQ
jgi:hypothetical protein